MADITPTIDGNRCERLTLTVSDKGAWVADVWLESDPKLQGTITIKVGTTSLVGTIVQQGQDTARTSLKIVAGAGAWGKVLPPKNYHLDVDVRAALVFADLCRETREKLGTFLPAAERLGKDYVRNGVAASTILESVIGAAKWWVDYSGLTHVGQIQSSSPKHCEVLGYDPIRGQLELALDDLNELRVGSTFSDRLVQPVSVQSYQITIGAAGIRALCETVADVPALLRSIIQHEIGASVTQLRKYRVIAMLPDGRVELMVANRSSGYPNLAPLRMWPGVGGAHVELTPGCEVIVQFVDGDRTQPIITHFVGKDGGGFRPVSIAFDCDDIRLGGLSPADAMAIASYVDARLASIKTAFNGHTHLHGPYTTTPGTPIPTATPLPMVGVLATVASTVVKA
jgi:hypothetical protein